MKELILSNDTYKMNWIEGEHEWGTVKCTAPLDVAVKSEHSGDIVKESYTFTNNTTKDVFTALTELGIYATFNDDYTDSATCLKSRCNTHIWCGGEVSYVMALRMGGAAPHLGLVLTKGSLGGYSVERDKARMSNDRGDFILHPSPLSLAPGESYTLEWTLFPFEDKADFYRQAKRYCGKFIEIEAEKYVLFKGEEINITIIPGFCFDKESVSLSENGRGTDFSIEGNKVVVRKRAESIGELNYNICIGGIHTKCRLLVQPQLDELVRARCRFIAANQQYHNAESRLDGAYLIYDNEEKHVRYTPKNDYNAGRERVGMGILIAKYLQTVRDETVETSLRKYIDFVRRELADEKTGEIFNDYMRDSSYKRLYNAPWFALFFTELYNLYREKEYLQMAYRILKYFYENGGLTFYAIEVPIRLLADALRTEGMTEELAELTEYFRRHSDYLLQNGTNYPKSEVNYEQSIVAPAADIQAQTYLLTGDGKYIDGIKEQMSVLELFNGTQPDYRLNEVAIRHWDGYWFGKSAMYGDTFPHYWSALTGIAYGLYAGISGSTEYAAKSEKSLRAVLSMYNPDGTATCAYVYPVTVNGEKAAYADAYANDQDWGLYFMLCFPFQK